jgi:DNA-binding NtrC family response regulator
MAPERVVTAALIDSWVGGAVQPAEEFTNLRPGRMLEDAERQLIQRTLGRYGGHRAKTAKALGIGVRTLGMKLKQWREEAAVAEGVAVLAGY